MGYVRVINQINLSFDPSFLEHPSAPLNLSDSGWETKHFPRADAMPRPLRYLARSLTFGAVTTAALLSLGAAKKKNGAKCFSWGPRFPGEDMFLLFFLAGG